jgi:ribokinase
VSTQAGRRVLVVGGANFDQTAVATRLPGAGETILATGYRETPGGKAANLASAAAAWGAPVSFVGRVGEDAFGDRLLDAWREVGVDTRFVIRDPAGTGLGLVFMDSAGHYQTVVVPRANARLEAADVGRVPASLWTEVGAVAMALEAPAGAVLAAARTASQRDLAVVLNAAPVEGMHEDLWPLVSHLVVNEHEAALLTDVEVRDRGSATVAAEALLLQLDPARAVAVIVTLGAQGAVVATPGRPAAAVPAPPVVVVDTLGAGDTFVGVLAAEVASGQGLAVAVAAACRAGAVSVTVPGARAGVTPVQARPDAEAFRVPPSATPRHEGVLA